MSQVTPLPGTKLRWFAFPWCASGGAFWWSPIKLWISGREHTSRFQWGFFSFLFFVPLARLLALLPSSISVLILLVVDDGCRPAPQLPPPCIGSRPTRRRQPPSIANPISSLTAARTSETNRRIRPGKQRQAGVRNLSHSLSLRLSSAPVQPETGNP